ncbi:MAG: DUF3047 domain-containing protein, partial [Pseudomonadota bacterium]
MGRATIFGLSLVAALVIASISPADARCTDMAGGIAFPFGPSLSAAGWNIVKFPNRAPVRFAPSGRNSVTVETASGAGLMWHKVPEQFWGAEEAKWRWRKSKGVGATDLTRKGGDDRVLAVYFAFADP